MSQTNQADIMQYNRGIFTSLSDSVVREFMLTLIINDTAVSSFVCSWNHIEHLVIGYLFCEGWIFSLDEILALEIEDSDFTARVFIPKIRFQQKNKEFFISSGCGYKRQSSRSWDAAPRKPNDFSLAPTFIINFMKQFQQASPLFHSTGGVHSVALIPFDQDWILEEDIGRHNALDKAIGYGLKHQISFSQTIIITSGRITADMLLKIAPLPIPILISKSAPTDAAISVALDIGVTLIGFARGERFNIYTCPERIHENTP